LRCAYAWYTGSNLSCPLVSSSVGVELDVYSTPDLRGLDGKGPLVSRWVKTVLKEWDVVERVGIRKMGAGGGCCTAEAVGG
jgi:hypothetical protein